MIDGETKALTIIDYEYSSYKPIAFDIANHFCEMAADYHSDTPHVLDYDKYPEDSSVYISVIQAIHQSMPKSINCSKMLRSILLRAICSGTCGGLYRSMLTRSSLITWSMKGRGFNVTDPQEQHY